MRFYKYYLKIDPSVPQAEREYYGVFLRSSHTQREYRRETYQLLEYLGDLGGLIDIILILVAFIVNQIIERQFNAAIMGRTFQIQTYNKD